jgi:hypothetical protein
MIRELFILPLIVGFIFAMVKIFQSKINLIVKLTLSFISLIIFLLTFSLSISSGWESGRQPREAVIKLENYPKSIYFFNEMNQSINIIVNFKYSKEEMLKYSKINLGYNKIDTIHSLRKGENKYRQIPILEIDTITKFPKNFNIIITDSAYNIIKTYNKIKFYKNIESPRYKDSKDEECRATSWDLKIK